jgi:hypothetical membrane protein
MSRDITVVKLGAIAWILDAQFYVAQVVVASRWSTPFDLSTRMISDLGNTACGPYPRPTSDIVCSPWHRTMNLSFVVVGITMAAGAMLTVPAFNPGWRRGLAVPLFVAAGVGVMLVGIYTENEATTNHAIGAGINFIAGNLALILFGLAWPRPQSNSWFGAFSVLSGVAGLVATVLFALGRDLGIGLGGMERVAAYTTTTWQIVAGLAILRDSSPSLPQRFSRPSVPHLTDLGHH